jgi:hypothetical protein
MSAGTTFHTYVGTTESVRSALAFANASASPTHVKLELTSSDASSPWSASASVDIPEGAHMTILIDKLFPEIPDRFEGLLRIVSSETVSAAHLRIRSNERGEQLINVLPISIGSSPPSLDLVFPLVVTGRGYSTSFIGVGR